MLAVDDCCRGKSKSSIMNSFECLSFQRRSRVLILTIDEEEKNANVTVAIVRGCFRWRGDGNAARGSYNNRE